MSQTTPPETTLTTTYDEVPYESSPFPDTHPNVTSAVALLFGLRAPQLDRCRVLELGCAGGGNLIPMALSFPEARFLGIDLSMRQIADGQAIVDRLGISNIELRAASILDVTTEWGLFDYIICHGVYSWVPSAVQNKILTICAQNLAANGIAYVSYNTYPGWHTRSIVRGMMRFHVTADATPRVRVQQAREFLDFLIESLPAQNTPYSKLLREEALVLRTQPDSYVLHEQLEENNEPLYFHEFAQRAAAHGLQYVSDARLGSMFVPLPPQVLETLAGWSQDLIEHEQYLDFVRDQTFRRTLLRHSEVPLRRPAAAEALFELHLTTRVGLAPASAQCDVRSASVVKFSSARSISMSTSDPVAKAALVCLTETWPRVYSFDALRKEVLRRLAGDDGPHPNFDENTPGLRLAEPLLECVMPGLVWIYRSPLRIAWEPSERPLACPLARIQAEGRNLVTSRTHILVELGDFDRRVLAWLDGSRSREDLLELVTHVVAAGEVTPALDGSNGPALPVDRAGLRQSIEACLRRLAAARLLLS